MPHFINKLRSVIQYTVHSDRAFIPLEILLILTDQCNYNCQVCSLWKGIYQDPEKAPLSLEEITSLIDQCALMGVPTFLISGGEPLLHPHFLEIVEYAARRLSIVRLNTNGSLITEEIAGHLVRFGLQEIWISLDGPPEYYDRFRGVPDAYRRTVAGLQCVIEAKKRQGSSHPRILVDTIVTPTNLDMLAGFVGSLAKLGVEEINLVHTCFVPPEAVKETERILNQSNIYSGQFSTAAGAIAAGARLASEQVIEIRGAAGQVGLYIDPLLIAPAGNNRPPCRCLFPWMNMMIFPHGDACVCPLLDFVTIGNVKNQPIREIWNSQPMRKIRRSMQYGFPLCERCICTRRTPLDHLKHRQTLKRVF
jgi:MoaA/NifB/PqqE/SkfB family radical SAM enzyme